MDLTLLCYSTKNSSSVFLLQKAKSKTRSTLRKALNVVLQNQVLTDEVLLTAFAEVEWVVNSRPLTEVSSDVDDLEALTPNLFLIGRGCLNLPPGIVDDKELSSCKRWRQAQVVANHTWSRWLREYLPSLQSRRIFGERTLRLSSRNVWPPSWIF